MRQNPVRHALARGETVLGTMVFEFGTPGIGRLAAMAGAEFLLLDTEHNGWSVETVRSVVAAARATDVVPLVRVPAAQYHLIARVLDVGALGVMVPMVEEPGQAELLAASCRYPPAGRRGFGLVFRDDWEGDLRSTTEKTNEEILTIAQIETARGLENVEEIAAVPGIDVLLVGFADLTLSLGIPGEYEHPDYLAALDRIAAACAAHGKAAGILSSSVAEARSMLDRGYRFLAYGIDLVLYERTLREGLDALRGGGAS